MENNQIALKQQGRASLQFLGSLRAAASGELRSKAKKLFEEKPESKDLMKNSENRKDKSSGDWLRLINKADELAREEPEYRFERFYQHHGGREVWTRGITAVEELRDEIEDDWKALSSQGKNSNLILNKNINYPNYFNIEFHTQPGGWDAYDLYPAVFQYGFGPHVFRYGGYAAIDPGQKHTREQILEVLPKDDYESIFEPGCGAGGMLFSAKQLYPHARLVGCDLSETFLKQAWRISESLNFDIQFKQALAENTGEHSNSYDAVISYAFFHEIPVRTGIEVVNEMFRLLKPGGDFLLCDMPYFQDISLFQAAILHHETIYHDEPYVSTCCATDWKKIFNDAGFENVFSKSLYNGPGKFPYVYVGTKPE